MPGRSYLMLLIIGIGDGAGEGGAFAPPPLPKIGKYFSGKYHKFVAYIFRQNVLPPKVNSSYSYVLMTLLIADSVQQ